MQIIQINPSENLGLFGQIVEIEKLSFLYPIGEKELLQQVNNTSYQFDACVMEELHFPKVIAYLITQKIEDEYHIMQLATHPSFRRQGYARNLIQFLMKRASEVGIKSIWLEVRKQDSSVVTFYQSCGFNLISIRKNYYQRENDDALVMRLEI